MTHGVNGNISSNIEPIQPLVIPSTHDEIAKRAGVILAAVLGAQHQGQSENLQPTLISQAKVKQTLSLPEGHYEGGVQNGVPHGDGILTYKPGNIRKSYDGEWQNGKFHGKGLLKYTNERKESGQWLDGKLHGKAFVSSNDDGKYDGNFIQGQPHGFGVKTYRDGTIYEGNWENGKPHGKGKFFHTKDQKYEGNVANGKKNGPGTYTYSEKHTYTGEWLNDKKHGKGTEVNDGAVWDGSFNNNQFWTGTYTTKNGFPYNYLNGVEQFNWIIDGAKVCMCNLVSAALLESIPACVTACTPLSMNTIGFIAAGIGGVTTTISAIACCVMAYQASSDAEQAGYQESERTPLQQRPPRQLVLDSRVFRKK